MSTLLGTGTGAFAAPVNFPTGAGPGGVVMGDFNADGRPDLAVSANSANTVSILLSTSSCVPSPTPTP